MQMHRNSEEKISLYAYVAWIVKGCWTLIPNANARTASVMTLIEEELLLMGKDVYNDESFSEKVSVWTSDEYRYEVEASIFLLAFGCRLAGGHPRRRPNPTVSRNSSLGSTVQRAYWGVSQ